MQETLQNPALQHQRQQLPMGRHGQPASEQFAAQNALASGRRDNLAVQDIEDTHAMPQQNQVGRVGNMKPLQSANIMQGSTRRDTAGAKLSKPPVPTRADDGSAYGDCPRCGLKVALARNNIRDDVNHVK